MPIILVRGEGEEMAKVFGQHTSGEMATPKSTHTAKGPASGQLYPTVCNRKIPVQGICNNPLLVTCKTCRGGVR